MDNINSILSLSPVMPVLTINKLDKVEYLFDALLEGGLKTVEITLRTSCALEVIEKISKEYPSLKIGAGTVLNNENLQSVKDAGATFAVSPGSTLSLGKKAIEMKIPFLPGISNSSDIMNLINFLVDEYHYQPADLPISGLIHLHMII